MLPLVLLILVTVAEPRDSTLYQHAIVEDLTGDGQADTVVLVVSGRALDSASARLEIRNGSVLFQDSWSTEGYAETAGSLTGAQLDAFILRELRAAVRVQPMTEGKLREPGVTDRSELQNTPFVVMLHRGWENDEMIAWSTKRGKFVTMWSCC